MIIALIIIIIILRAKIDIVENDAENLRADVNQKLTRAADDLPRAFARMNDENYAVNERCNQNAVRERSDRRRINDDVRKRVLHDLKKFCHLLRPD